MNSRGLWWLLNVEKWVVRGSKVCKRIVAKYNPVCQIDDREKEQRGVCESGCGLPDFSYFL